MGDKNKAEVTATIKFRGVTIEGMTVQELRELRDVLNSLVGERVVERHDHYPVYTYPSYPNWYVGSGSMGLSSSDTLLSNVGANTLTLDNTGLHYGINNDG